MGKDSFILYNEQFECFSLLSMEQRGLLITAIFEYQINGKTEQPLSESAYMAYHLITSQLNRDSQKYKRICEKRKAAIESRYVQMNTNEYKCIQENTDVTDNDNDNDTDNDTDTDLKEKTNKKEKSPKEEETPPKEEEKKPSVIEERFNQFWSVYPKKVAKGYAFECFKKLKPTAELTQKMIDAVSEQKKSHEWTKDNGEYIPNPSTWLNQKRWEDELTKAEDPKPNATIPKYGNYDANEAMQKAVNRSYSQATPNPSTAESDADKLFAEALQRTYGG